MNFDQGKDGEAIGITVMLFCLLGFFFSIKAYILSLWFQLSTFLHPVIPQFVSVYTRSNEKTKWEFLTVDNKKSPLSPGGNSASLMAEPLDMALVKHRYFPWTCISLGKEHGEVFTSQTGTVPPDSVYEQSLLS